MSDPYVQFELDKLNAQVGLLKWAVNSLLVIVGALLVAVVMLLVTP